MHEGMELGTLQQHRLTPAARRGHSTDANAQGRQDRHPELANGSRRRPCDEAAVCVEIALSAAPAAEAVLAVEDVQTRFHTQEGVVHAVNGIGFELEEGEVLGVVGESGSGKSVTMLSLLGLLPTPPAEIVSGSAKLEGEDLMALDADRLREVRGARVGFIFQDPMTSLNPVLTVGYQLMEPLRVHLGMDKAAARERAAQLLDLVGIPESTRRLSDFPHQFSGGMRQRVMIAIALACSPKVLIADEPTTALDVTIQAQILDVVKRLRRELGMSIIWITHDLGVVAGLADRVMVMYGGQVGRACPCQIALCASQAPLHAGLAAHSAVTGGRGRTVRAPRQYSRTAAESPSSAGIVPLRAALRACLRSLPPRRTRRSRRWATATRSPASSTSMPARPVPTEPATTIAPTRSGSDATGAPVLVEVENLAKHFPIMRGVFRRQVGSVRAVDGVDFQIRERETLGLVGESGCGKSTAGRVILRLYEPTTGRIAFRGEDIGQVRGESLRRLRQSMQMVFQDPQDSLNPRMTVGSIVGEPLVEHGDCEAAAALDERVDELLNAVGFERALCEPLSARVLGRPAPAHRHRPGARPRTGVHRLRRTHRRARRLDPGPGGEPPAGSAGAARTHLPFHLPRPRHGPSHCRPGRGDVPRQDRRAGPER